MRGLKIVFACLIVCSMFLVAAPNAEACRGRRPAVRAVFRVAMLPIRRVRVKRQARLERRAECRNGKYPVK